MWSQESHRPFRAAQYAISRQRVRCVPRPHMSASMAANPGSAALPANRAATCVAKLLRVRPAPGNNPPRHKPHPAPEATSARCSKRLPRRACCPPVSAARYGETASRSPGRSQTSPRARRCAGCFTVGTDWPLDRRHTNARSAASPSPRRQCRYTTGAERYRSRRCARASTTHSRAAPR